MSSLGRLPKLTHGGHTIPASRRNVDRYYIGRLKMDSGWGVYDSLDGCIISGGRFVGSDVPMRALAAELADELNGETAT